MILLKDKKFNIKMKNNLKTIESVKLKRQLQRLIKKYESEYNFEYYECPYCGNTKCMYYGTYTRNIGIFGEYYKIKIKRVKCKRCNHTHALIPSFITPYFQEEMEYIINIITEVEVNKNTINKVSKITKQDRKVIAYIIKRFKEHETRLLTTFNYKIKKILSMLKEIENRIEYIRINGIRFLEKVPT